MKKLLIAVAALLLGGIQLTNLAQQAQETPRPLRLDAVVGGKVGGKTFDFDFPGGVPQDLVTAIEKSSGEQLNVIIPPQLSQIQIPPLKFHSVSVSSIFMALSVASRSLSEGRAMYGFHLVDNSTPGVWIFTVDKLAEAKQPKVCRYYQLGPYLDELNYKIDDITTAIQTGWKMMGDQNPPELKFHKDTKLLIAVGEPMQLEVIDSVIKELAKARPPTSPKQGAEGKKI